MTEIQRQIGIKNPLKIYMHTCLRTELHTCRETHAHTQKRSATVYITYHYLPCAVLLIVY